MTGNQVLVYAPEVRVQISTWDGMHYDISKDLVSGSITRRIDSVSSVSLRVSNRKGRYTGKISRMDRIVVFLKKTSWIQVFAGYVTKTPAMSLHDSDITLAAECTLKRLLHTYWDPGLADSAELLVQKDLNQPDAGIRKTLVQVLEEVAGWNPAHINIQQIPPAFISLAKDHISKQDPEIEIQKLIQALGLGGVMAGVEQDELTGGLHNGETGGLEDIEAFMKALRLHESNDNYKARNPGYTDAAGAYQYISTTWANYGGYASADQAPKSVQDARARKDLTASFERFKDWEKVAANHLYPIWANDKSKWNQTPGPGNPTVRQFVDSVISKMNKFKKDGGAQLDAAQNSTPTTVQGKEKMIYPVNAPETSPFGYRGSGFDAANNAIHTGLDLGCPSGTPIKAALSGKVVEISSQAAGGNYIRLDHGEGFSTGYYHITRANVPNGAQVKQGDVIAISGATGNVSGPHLHFQTEVNRTPKDPKGYLGNAVNVSSDGSGTPLDPESSGAPSDIGTAIFNALYKVNPLQQLSSLLTGDRAMINDEPLMTTIQSLSKASLRSFMSMPDGQFVAFFPDQFGLFGISAKLELTDVEMKDVKIDASDGPITTHVFTFGDTDGVGGVNLVDWVSGGGMVHILQDYVFKQILNLQPENNRFFNPEEFLKRFGARPLRADFPQIKNTTFEYFQALYIFMQKWSQQYATSVEFTFMPELYPGMRVILKSQGISVYVEEVTHNFDFTTGFTTSAVISSPSSVNGGGPAGLPIGRV